MNKRTNSKENDTISKKTGNKARQLSIYFFQAISLIALLFCVWLLTREKEYREIDVNTVAQKRIEYQKSCFEGYGVDQMELINNAMTITYGHYMLFIVSKDSSLARDAFADATAK